MQIKSKAIKTKTTLNSKYLLELEELVNLNTVSPLGKESISSINGFFESYFIKKGAGDYWVSDNSIKKNIIIYSHIDTKPPIPLNNWRFSPFKLIKKGRKLFGLGISDSKFQLLNAITIFPPNIFMHIIDGGEEIGSLGIKRAFKNNSIEKLIIIDGFIEEEKIYHGTSGQLDGYIYFSTGERPSSSSRKINNRFQNWLLELLNYINDSNLHFNITGIYCEPFERSITLEEMIIRFDIRFNNDEKEKIESFLKKYNPIIKQYYRPLVGRAGKETSKFSNHLGNLDLDVKQVIVVPGALPNNNNHQPNEWIYISQILAHQKKLIELRREII